MTTTPQKKICPSCGAEKKASEFGVKRSQPNGMRSRCKACTRIDGRRDYRTRRDHFIEKAKHYRSTRVQILRSKSRAYNKRHKAKLSIYAAVYAKKRRANDPNFRQRQNLRSQLTRCIRTGSTSPTVLELIDVTSTAELRAHFERQFEPGMSWNNYGRGGWEIDHIKPLCQFDLTDQIKRKEAFSLSNLRPKWWNQNRGLNRYKKEDVSHTS